MYGAAVHRERNYQLDIVMLAKKTTTVTCLVLSIVFGLFTSAQDIPHSLPRRYFIASYFVFFFFSILCGCRHYFL